MPVKLYGMSLLLFIKKLKEFSSILKNKRSIKICKYDTYISKIGK
jgi:hypothetical protein